MRPKTEEIEIDPPRNREVRVQMAWSGMCQPATRAQEQPGADGTADRNHLQLSRLETLVVPLILGIQGGGAAGRPLRCGRHWAVPSTDRGGCAEGGGFDTSRKVSTKPNTPSTAAAA